MLVRAKDESREVKAEGGWRVQLSSKRATTTTKKSERGEIEGNAVEETNLPQPSIHSSCSSGDYLGDENPWIIRNVGIVYSSSNAKAQARVTLNTDYDEHLH